MKSYNFDNAVLVIGLANIIIAEDLVTKKLPDCSTVRCAPPPEKCPNSKRPVLDRCCMKCLIEPIHCARIKCVNVPKICSNGMPPAKMYGECCPQCPPVCCKGTCATPTRFCEADEVPRPPGSCCENCFLKCISIICQPCSAGEVGIESPNHCCPVCHRK